MRTVPVVGEPAAGVVERLPRTGGPSLMPLAIGVIGILLVLLGFLIRLHR